MSYDVWAANGLDCPCFCWLLDVSFFSLVMFHVKEASFALFLIMVSISVSRFELKWSQLNKRILLSWWIVWMEIMKKNGKSESIVTGKLLFLFLMVHFVSNRYQILAGVIEQRVLEHIFGLLNVSFLIFFVLALYLFEARLHL